MDQMARDYAGKAHFVFVYSREAHPDWYDDRPAPTSYEEKLENARDLRAMFDSPRVHLVDALDGDADRKYGGVSNMCWVIDHTGRVVYKGGWTIAADVQPVLDALLRMQDGKREGGHFAPYYKATMDWREMPGMGEFGNKPPPRGSHVASKR